MKWKTKALIQNMISKLPSELSYELYYQAQRKFGGYRNKSPFDRLGAGFEVCKRLSVLGYEVENKVFFEVGTGRNILMPLAYWLCGAQKTITVDINPYLKLDLISESILKILKNKSKVLSLSKGFLKEDNFDKLNEFVNSNKKYTTKQILDLCNIQYLAPGDASKTSINENSIDFHCSYTVYEHIPKEILINILEEGNRICKKGSVFINRIDYSDHFNQNDKSITKVNFLQFSDEEWDKYAGNRYMYMNRLRHDDYIELFKKVNHDLLYVDEIKDEASREVIENGNIKVHNKFSSKNIDILEIIGSWIISRKS